MKIIKKSKMKKFVDPFGSTKGVDITEEDINEVTSMWDKNVNELIDELAKEKD